MLQMVHCSFIPHEPSQIQLPLQGVWGGDLTKCCIRPALFMLHYLSQTYLSANDLYTRDARNRTVLLNTL